MVRLELTMIINLSGLNGACFPFQHIYFWEWLHRLLGRLVGLAFALPLAWFAMKRAIPRGYGWRLVALLLLGASQGALGWFMVQSCLADRTDVSHFRLSAHLLTALFILAGLVWTALDLRMLAKSGEHRPARLVPVAIGVTVVLISVFVPLAFFSGSTGNIYRQFSAVMVTSIAFSAFLALSLTPALCATLLKPIEKGQHHEKKGFFSKMFGG